MTVPVRVWAPPLAVLALGLSLTLPRLGSSGLWDPWEPRYAQAASEMRDRADWLVPYYRGDPRLNKPPLTYWLIGLAQGGLGRTETAARLPSALLAALCPALLALALALRRRPLEGALAGAALVGSPQWLLLGRFATPDIPLAAALGVLLAAVLARPALASRGARRVAASCGLLALVAAGLTDWPRGLLLPLWAVLGWAALGPGLAGRLGLVAVAALYTAGQFRASVWLQVASILLALVLVPLRLRSSAGVRARTAIVTGLVVVAILAPWFVAAARAEPGELSILEYKHAFNLGEDARYHRAPPWTVLELLALGGLPWCAAAAFGLLRGIGRERDETARVLGGALVGPMLFFALAEAKMGHFYAVMQPPLAGLAAIGLVGAVRERRIWPIGLTGATLAALAWRAWDEPSRILLSVTVKTGLFGERLGGAVALACGVWLAAVLAARIARRPAWLLAAVAPSAVLAGFLGLRMVPALEPFKSLRPMWARYLELRAPGEPIGAFGFAKDTGYYYSDNAIVRLRNPERLREYLAGPGTKFVVFPERDFRRLPPELAGLPWEVLDDRHPTHFLARVAPAP